MRRFLFVAALCLLVAFATASSDAEEQDVDSQDLSAADRALLGYIKVPADAPRNKWVNHMQDVHLIGQKRHYRRNRGVKKVVYKDFPVAKFLSPLRHLAKSLNKSNKRSMARYLRLRKIILRRGLFDKVSQSVAHRVHKLLVAKHIRAVQAAHEKYLQRKVAKLAAKVAKVNAAPQALCSATNSVYFCRRGRCACADRSSAVCNKQGARLTCRAAASVGTMCRCTRLSYAARQRALAAAALAKKNYYRTCNPTSARCRRAQELARHGVVTKWITRRKLLNKTYNKTYRHYVELLARYFRKKYAVMIRFYDREVGKDIRLKKKLHDLVIKHKRAMLSHARLHAAAFGRYSTLMAAYNALDKKYNALVDKYRIDMTAAVNRLKETKLKLAHERHRVHLLREKNAKLDDKIAFLNSEVGRHDALKDAADFDHKLLLAKHEALKARYAAHKRHVEDAIKLHLTRTQQLTDSLNRQKEDLTETEGKLAQAQADAKAAALKAKHAYNHLKAKLHLLRTQSAEAEEHEKAAIAALAAQNDKLEKVVHHLKARKAARKARRAARRAARAARISTINHNNSKATLAQNIRAAMLKSKLAATRKALRAARHRAHHYGRLLHVKKPHHKTAAQRAAHARHVRHMLAVFRKEVARLSARVHGLRKALIRSRLHKIASRKHAKHFRRLARRNKHAAAGLRAKYDALLARFQRKQAIIKAERAEIKHMHIPRSHAARRRAQARAARRARRAAKHGRRLHPRFHNIVRLHKIARKIRQLQQLKGKGAAKKLARLFRRLHALHARLARKHGNNTRLHHTRLPLKVRMARIARRIARLSVKKGKKNAARLHKLLAHLHKLRARRAHHKRHGKHHRRHHGRRHHHHRHFGKPAANWHGYSWYRVRVPGAMTNANIKAACSLRGLETPCDHPAYANGQCSTIVKRALHLSYAPHHNLNYKVIRHAYFYTGDHHLPLQAIHHSHKWAAATDTNGVTLCVHKQPTPHGYQFTFNGFKFYRTRVHGLMNAANARHTCDKHNMFVPCDHPAYADGHCVAITKRAIHLSYNGHHNLNRKAVDRVYFYAGATRNMLQNWRNTHRWSAKGDINEDTMCVAPVVYHSKPIAAVWKGFKWHKVLVQGHMTNQNIHKACHSKGLKTPCDHSAYADGHCVVINGAHHMSYNGHHNFPRKVIDRTYWYTGGTRHPLQNWHNTHRWANPTGDMWEYTLCVEPSHTEA